ncbi:MAG: hypothetical protein R6U00_09820 [Prochlorococcaceae cyanobacterium]|jgi:hypothetical protein
MAGLSDRAYTTICARLASALGVSLASARRRVDIRAAQAGIRDPEAKRALAEQVLAELQGSGGEHHTLLTGQLGAVGSDENFMVED